VKVDVRFQAIVFDMDGVLTDSEPRHFEALNTLLAEFGTRLAEADYAHLAGHHGDYTWRWLVDRFGLAVDFDEWRDRYDPIIVSLLRRPAAPLPGIRALAGVARSRGLRLALASTSRTSWITAVLASLRMEGAFDTVVSGDMVMHGKPAPDIYLLAAERLSLAPHHCLAIEDSAPGVQAAKTAGMYTIQLRATPQAAPPQPAADLVLDDLRRFPLALLDAGDRRELGDLTDGCDNE
jgi:HAD superfamily hydrolase (TIGR01509 family)